MRQFFLTYSKGQTLSDDSERKKQLLSDGGKAGSIPPTPSANFKLSWSHYLTLMRIEDEAERLFYEIESAKNN